MCHVLKIQRSGFYAWLKQPQSQRSKDDNYLLGFIKQVWLESGCVYGYRKIYKDLRVSGDQCGRNRVLRLMKNAKTQSQRGYKRQNKYHADEVSTIAPNLLNREFNVVEPNKVWVTDITYVRTQQGWLFLAVVIDLFSRQLVGWSMSKKIDTDLALDALTMACWRRNPKQEVIVHSDQGCQNLVKLGLDRGTPYPEEALYVYVYARRKKIGTPSNSWLINNQSRLKNTN
jgi:putative transposase